jgi:hypothetical protein
MPENARRPRVVDVAVRETRYTVGSRRASSTNTWTTSDIIPCRHHRRPMQYPSSTVCGVGRTQPQVPTNSPLSRVSISHGVCLRRRSLDGFPGRDDVAHLRSPFQS